MRNLGVTALCFAAVAAAGSIKDITNVVLFMQENRAFDHYFGTMAGVRGFRDPNVQINPDGRSTYYQYVDSKLSTATDYLLPFYAGYLGGNATEALQCASGGDNGWAAMHEVYNNGLNNFWAVNNTAYSLMYLKRDDLPVQFELAEGYTVGDMYQQGVLAVTWPNRVFWQSGTIGVPGGPQNSSEGGPLLTNYNTPGCQQTDPQLNCVPLEWETFPEILQNAGVTWQTYHNTTSYTPESLNLWQNFQNISPGDPLYDRGLAYYTNNTLAAFLSQAEAGTLPQVSYVVTPQAIQEHPPYGPLDGGWFQKQLVDAVVNGARGQTTVIILSYDESGGWMDHVTPYHSPEGTAGEWMEDPYGQFGEVFAGPGARVPFYIISPWTRGGNVFSEHADHVSQILFLEQWLQAKGYDVKTDQISDWRREHMSNLVNAFDFDNPDYTLPTLSSPPAPILGSDSTDTYQDFITESLCAAKYNPKPTVPYGQQPHLYSNTSLYTEFGFKKVRGALTEGRYLTFESDGYALTNANKSTTVYVSATAATENHEDAKQRWVLHQYDDTESSWYIRSAADGRYVTVFGGLTDEECEAETFVITYTGASTGYTIQTLGGLYVTLFGELGVVSVSLVPTYFTIYSVTYDD